MIQLSIPLARYSDPITSHISAEKAESFKARQEATIYTAICEAGERGATYKEIAKMTGMEPVKVARRLSRMESPGLLITRYLNEFKEPAEVRDGCAVWWKR